MKSELKQVYVSPEVDILDLINEGVVCDSTNSGTGEGFGWDDEE